MVIPTNPNTYPIALFALMVILVLAILLVLSRYRNTEIPKHNVSGYIQYFITGLCGWLINGLGNYSGQELVIIDRGIFYYISSYLLLVAVSTNQAPYPRHKFWLFITAVTITLSLFIQNADQLILLLSTFAIATYIPISYYSLKNSNNSNNLGYYFISFAVSAIIFSSVIQIYLLIIYNNAALASSIALIGAASGYTLIGIGFIASILFQENQLLLAHATKDPLTNLFNRRGMEFQLRQVLSNLPTSQQCLSVITLDIDHFKKINDSYGHDVGDKFLIAIAEVLTQQQNDNNIVCRLGGEEFAIIMINVPTKLALTIAEQLRVAIEKIQLTISNTQISTTSSFGVATQEKSVDLESLLKQADKALYTAKNKGRNQVCFLN